jgi:hypothetical protein
VTTEVCVDVSRARLSAREAIVANVGDYMNPGEARRLADELRIAADFVDLLSPPAALGKPAVGSVTVPNYACDCCNLGTAAHCLAGEHCITSRASCGRGRDHEPNCCDCRFPLIKVGA